MDLEALAGKYIESCKRGRDWFKDLLAYAVSLHGKPPYSARTYVSAARSWLEYTLNKELTRKQARLLLGRLPRGTRARTQEDEMTRETLRAVLAHADAKGRALFLLLASSGLRVGSALQLKLEDVDLTADPPVITVRGEYTKSGDMYVTFISSEAREALEQWVRIRKDYLKSAANRGRGLGRIKERDDTRLFPFSIPVAETMWYTAIAKAGLNRKDPSTNRYRLHIHMLRKWFLSQAKLAAPETVVEAWAGHTGYLDEAYRRYTKTQLGELYKKAEPYLLVNIPKDIHELQTKTQKDIQELRDQIADLTRKLTDANALALKFMDESSQSKAKLETVSKEIEELKRLIGELTA